MFRRFKQIAKNLGNRVALSNEAEQVSFVDLLSQVETLRPLLRSEDNPIIVLLALPSGPSFTAVQLASLAEHAVVAPISHQSKTHEVRNYLHLIQPDLVVVASIVEAESILEALDEPTTILVRQGITHQGCGHRIISWSELSPTREFRLEPHYCDLPAGTRLIQFTSGSTGHPKGILLSENNILSYLDNNRDFLEQFRGFHAFCPMPQFHAFCGTVVLEHLFSEASVHLANTFMPGEDVNRMVELKCGTLLAAPTYLKFLHQMGFLNSSFLPNLTSVSLGTAMVEQALIQNLREGFPDLVVHLRYGLTETMGPITRLSLGPDESLDSKGFVGAPVSGVSLAPDLPLYGKGGSGQVRVKSPVIAQGQLHSRDKWTSLLDADGYFSTGDLGCLDQNGGLHLRGRISSFIKRNGFRINPFEIEALLQQQSGVAEVVVVGIPDPHSGQRIVACIELNTGQNVTNEKILMGICRDNLSVHKLPQSVIIFKELPRTPSGKPDRTLLVSTVSGKPS